VNPPQGSLCGSNRSATCATGDPDGRKMAVRSWMSCTESATNASRISSWVCQCAPR
jgi:hypothetical protein